MQRLLIRNTSQAELGVMLEPWTDREDIAPGGQVILEGDFSADDLGIDFGDENFLSLWCPAGCKLRKVC